MLRLKDGNKDGRQARLLSGEGTDRLADISREIGVCLTFLTPSHVSLRVLAACLTIAFAILPRPSGLKAEGLSLDKMDVHSLGGSGSWKVADAALGDAVSAKEACDDSRWKDLSTIAPEQEKGKAFVSYCRSFDLAVLPSGPVAIDLGVIDNTDRTYLNGRLIGSTGNMELPDAQGYDRRRVYTVDSSLFRLGKNVLVIQTRRYWLTGDKWFDPDQASIGPSSRVERSILGENYRRSFFLAVYFATASYFLFLFLNRRHEKENLYFALLVYALVLYQFLKTQMKYDFFDSLLLLKKSEYLILTTLGPLLYLFVSSYFPLPEGRSRKVGRVLAAIAMAVSGLSVLVFLVGSEPLTWSWFNKRVHLPIAVPILSLLSLYHLFFHAMRRVRDAIILTSGIGVVLLSTFVDALTTYDVWHLPFVTGYTFFFFVLNIAVILSHRFVRLHSVVEDLNENLEQKVEERTDELNYSLKQLQVLKEKQDGDYFLTSLLIQPLAGVIDADGPVGLRMLTKQKKTFQFRNKDVEIGGDISIGDRIYLRDTPYTAFINADAMGKSIQGAGGALVVGTVFRALLSRTKTVDMLRQRSPEQWMKDAYREIQDVFCSFDGSMLVSAFFGLLDERSGVLYYINAEHPRAVLYREGTARFIESQDVFYKFGIDTFQPRFRVGISRLMAGDVLILGTDGRDDLIIRTGDSLSINDDMDRFLGYVSQAKGDLDIILNLILETGLLTDDLSLLRIGFREDEVAAAADQVDGMRDRALACFNTHDYESALVLFEQFAEIDPSDTEVLFAISVARRKLAQKKSDISWAIDAGERVRMRIPDHRDNLRNLAKCYEALGSRKAASLREKLSALESSAG